jgi:predicted RND superfamily exporter protein
LDQMFGRYFSPLVILPETRAQTQAISAKLKALKSKQGPSSLISHVYSIDDFVPPQQLEKIRILRQIQSELRPSIVRQLSGADARLVRESMTTEAFTPFTVADLPPLIRARFREKDGSIGKPVLVEPMFKSNVMDEFANQKRFVDDVRGAADSVDPDSAVVGQLPLTVDMIGSISHDGPRATLFAFAAVVLLAVILFRQPVAILQSIFVLLLGVTWMACAALALDLRINFLNFIALPITFGIGMDYGVNLLARIRKEGASRIVDIVSTTGGAVALASLTTIIGYGSLLLAGNQGFVSFGRLAILGEITTLSAALFVLPAFLRWRAPSASQAQPEALPIKPRKTSRAA